jgi:hypothetical protein
VDQFLETIKKDKPFPSGEGKHECAICHQPPREGVSMIMGPFPKRIHICEHCLEILKSTVAQIKKNFSFYPKELTTDFLKKAFFKSSPPTDQEGGDAPLLSDLSSYLNAVKSMESAMESYLNEDPEAHHSIYDSPKDLEEVGTEATQDPAKDPLKDPGSDLPEDPRGCDAGGMAPLGDPSPPTPLGETPLPPLDLAPSQEGKSHPGEDDNTDDNP